MSLKVPCDVKGPQTTFTTGNIRAGSRSYADVVKTDALGDHTYCDNATIQHNSDGVTGAFLEHDYYDCDSEFQLSAISSNLNIRIPARCLTMECTHMIQYLSLSLKPMKSFHPVKL